nr:MAG TPA: hypothetical protein [Caudoviricetes sp.]DAW55921.1 MAG TPA: hypothetical protein [Caudoviricetes sp.]
MRRPRFSGVSRRYFSMRRWCNSVKSCGALC